MNLIRSTSIRRSSSLSRPWSKIQYRALYSKPSITSSTFAAEVSTTGLLCCLILGPRIVSSTSFSTIAQQQQLLRSDLKMSSSANIIKYFTPGENGADSCGRTLDMILSSSDHDLEMTHDYIQNLFPLPEGSLFNQDIWIVGPETYDAFRKRPELRHRLDTALTRMCSFYGLDIDHTADTIKIVRSQDFDRNKKFWLSRFNHNHLRITRILRSLRVLGLPQHCQALHTFLKTDEEVVSKVSERSQMYWARAALRPLYLPPDVNDTDGGIAWLKDRD